MPHSALLAALGPANVSLADPPGSSVLLSAVSWVQGALLGPVATTIAIIAFAWIGFAMLSGRMRIRPGVTVIFGCFILFGASSIVSGLRSSLGGTAPASLAYEPPPLPPPAVPPAAQAAPVASATPSDPYAGASVPRQ